MRAGGAVGRQRRDRHGHRPVRRARPARPRKPDGHRRLRVRRIYRARHRAAALLFTKMGFPEVARHKRKNVTLHRQGDINFIINAEPGSYAEIMPAPTGRAPAPWPSGSRMRRPPMSARSSLGATNVEVDVAMASSTFPRSRASAARVCSSSTAMATKGIDLRRRLRLPSRLARADGRADSHLTYIDHLTHNVQREAVAVPEHWSVGQTVDYLRAHPDLPTISTTSSWSTRASRSWPTCRSAACCAASARSP